MIQRIQSLWLLLAGLLNTGILFFDLYRYNIVLDGLSITKSLKVSDHYVSLVMVVLIALLPIVALFMFTNRKKQMGITVISMISCMLFISMTLWRVTGINKLVPPPSSGNYWIGAVLPVIAILFLILALSGIKKDEKLVKSMDRLR